MDKTRIQNFLNSIPDDFDILEQGVDSSMQEEYLRFSQKLKQRESQRNIFKRAQGLFLKETPPQIKKCLLIKLAHLGTVGSYQTIKKFFKQSDKELASWTVLALRECRMLLESQLLEEAKGFISTGLGGKERKLRYCVVIRSKDGVPFIPRHISIIQEQWQRTCKELDVELENFSFQANYFLAKILVSMETAVGDVIERGIENCKREESCLKFHYYVTNVRQPTEKDIEEYLKEIKD